MNIENHFSKITILRYSKNIDLFKSIKPSLFLDHYFEFNLVLKCDPIWEDIYLNPSPFGISTSNEEWIEKLNSIGQVISSNPFLWLPSSKESITKISNSLSFDSSTFFFQVKGDTGFLFKDHETFLNPLLFENTLICLKPMEDYTGFEIFARTSVLKNTVDILNKNSISHKTSLHKTDNVQIEEIIINQLSLNG